MTLTPMAEPAGLLVQGGKGTKRSLTPPALMERLLHAGGSSVLRAQLSQLSLLSVRRAAGPVSSALLEAGPPVLAGLWVGLRGGCLQKRPRLPLPLTFAGGPLCAGRLAHGPYEARRGAFSPPRLRDLAVSSAGRHPGSAV